MLQTTTILAETATVVGTGVGTTKSTIDVQKDKDGNAIGATLNKRNATTTAAVLTTASTGLNSFQNWTFEQTMKSVKVENAIAYVESLTDEELERFDKLLEEKELALMAEEASKEAVQKVKTL